MDELTDKRQQWFDIYKERLERLVKRLAELGANFTCPCCGYPTLPDRRAYDICPLCNWEDDGQDGPHADEVWGGPNSDYSLLEARANFKEHLTMYRPSDENAHKRHLQKLPGKRELMSVYDRILEVQGAYNFRDEFERLRSKAKRLTDEL
jgi:hypothetical protein